MRNRRRADGGSAAFSKLFGPGRHTIRIDIEGSISNPVEIDIPPAKEAATAPRRVDVGE